MLAGLTGPGRIIVSSAGNDGAKTTYIHKGIGKERAGTFLRVNPKSFGCTAKSRQPFMFRVSIYNKVASPKTVDVSTVRVCSSKDSLLTDSVLVDGKMYKWSVLAFSNSYNRQETAYDLRLSCKQELGDNPKVSLQIVGRDADVELYRTSGEMFTDVLDPTLNAGDCSRTVFSPSSSPDVISVGATGYRTRFINYLNEKNVYNNGTNGVRTPFSAMGPTFDGRIKPDVMAPGQNIISSYSSFYISNTLKEDGSVKNDLKSDIRRFEYNGRTYSWNANAGTSMSAPVVTGAIALWLQADPTLTTADCMDIFAKTCTHYDSSLSYPNNLYGYGQIDVMAGLQEVLRRKALGINAIERKEEPSDNRIFLLDGRYVGTDESNLPKGIYIRNGKKLMKCN